jgi:hypothetical protein
MPPSLTQLYHEPRTLPATIAAGASLSAAVRLPPGHYLAAIVMPAAWTAAGITFQASADGVTYNDVHDINGTEISVTVAASRIIVLPPTDWYPVPFVRVRSGTSAVPVNQLAERALALLVKPL